VAAPPSTKPIPNGRRVGCRRAAGFASRCVYRVSLPSGPGVRGSFAAPRVSLQVPAWVLPGSSRRSPRTGRMRVMALGILGLGLVGLTAFQAGSLGSGSNRQ
jgi:hypothetical protein